MVESRVCVSEGLEDFRDEKIRRKVPGTSRERVQGKFQGGLKLNNTREDEENDRGKKERKREY
jgi:hypothetical protein